jgi:2-methylcitrate dehydratase PrpD
MLLKLGAYAADVGTGLLPVEIQHAAKQRCVDWFATTVPGSVVAPATLLREALAEDIDRGGARLIPDGALATTRTAAYINAAASHTVEFDDIYGPGVYHPGVSVISAALAIAEDRQVSGLLFLKAIVAGYEISNRIGAALQPAHYRYWHTTGTVGTFGAAAAASVILGLNATETAHALANSATFSAGLKRAFLADSMSKPLHAAHAAESGLTAALAAAKGVTGTLEVLDAAGGFGDAMGDAPDWEAAFADLGKAYTITRMTTKNHGCCGHTFAAIDTALDIQNQHDLAPADIIRISAGSYSNAVDVTGNPNPHTEYEGKFSLPYCVSTALVHGSVRMDSFTEERLNDPETRRLMGTLDLYLDKQADEEFPNQRGAFVEIETKDGRVLSHRRRARKGDPDDPLSDEDLEAKYRELVAPVLGGEQTDILLASLWSLESLLNMLELSMVGSIKPTLKASSG